MGSAVEDSSVAVLLLLSSVKEEEEEEEDLSTEEDEEDEGSSRMCCGEAESESRGREADLVVSGVEAAEMEEVAGKANVERRTSVATKMNVRLRIFRMGSERDDFGIW